MKAEKVYLAQQGLEFSDITGKGTIFQRERDVLDYYPSHENKTPVPVYLVPADVWDAVRAAMATITKNDKPPFMFREQLNPRQGNHNVHYVINYHNVCVTEFDEIRYEHELERVKPYVELINVLAAFLEGGHDEP